MNGPAIQSSRFLRIVCEPVGLDYVGLRKDYGGGEFLLGGESNAPDCTYDCRHACHSCSGVNDESRRCHDGCSAGRHRQSDRRIQPGSGRRLCLSPGLALWPLGLRVASRLLVDWPALLSLSLPLLTTGPFPKACWSPLAGDHCYATLGKARLSAAMKCARSSPSARPRGSST